MTLEMALDLEGFVASQALKLSYGVVSCQHMTFQSRHPVEVSFAQLAREYPIVASHVSPGTQVKKSVLYTILIHHDL